MHEFGHAFAVRRFGGEVHVMGIMFLIFSPLPYVDATAAWGFRSKAQRVLVGAAGMIVEVFVAACAAVVWANTGPGVLHSLAYNMIFVASVSTVIFNINPLLRYDGYYILSDLFDIPNLHTQATLHLRHLVERYAFGDRKSRSPASSGGRPLAHRLRDAQRDRTALSCSAASSCSLPIVSWWPASSWPPSARFPGSSSRCCAWSATLPLTRSSIATVCARLVRARVPPPRLPRSSFFARFPNSFKSPGVLKARDWEAVITRVGGEVREVLAASGTRVKVGDALLRMENGELDFKIRELEAKLVEVTPCGSAPCRSAVPM